MATYTEWANEHPIIAANIESVVNIGMLAAPVKAKPGVVGEAGQGLVKSGVKKSAANKKAFIEELVTPIQTKNVKVEQVGRTTEKGFLRRGNVELTRGQKESAKELLRVGVEPKRSIQKNYEIISTKVRQETDALVKKLGATGERGKLTPKDIDDLLDELAAAGAALEANPAIVGSAKEATKKVMAQMRREIFANKDHVSGMLAARKAFDHKFISQGRGAVLDPTLQNATTQAVREARKVVNGFIDGRVANVGVKQSLARQHKLLNALDDVAAKAAKESNSAIGRLYTRVIHALTLRGQINQTAAAMFGMGGLGAAAVWAPWILAGGVAAGIGIQGTRAIIAPGTRKALGNLLEWTAKMGADVRADRALIRELLLTAGDATEEDIE